MIDYKLTSSPRKNKRYRMTIFIKPLNKNYVIDFGDSSMENYTTHKDKTRLERYKKRHKNDNIEDIANNVLNSPGWWSLNLLWSRPNLDDALKYSKEKANKILYPFLAQKL